jgi:2-oxoglutarate ferredoxin oxidoreductase subunit alpha
MGQMMEPVIFPEPIDLKNLPPKSWILDGADGRPSRVIKSLLLDPEQEEELNWKLAKKYEDITNKIQDAETYLASDARLVIIAYGTAARIAKGAVNRVRDQGFKVGLFRPITLYPFPKRLLVDLGEGVKDLLVFEMSTGQMVEDVMLSIEGRRKIHFYGRPGGIISTPHEIAEKIKEVYKNIG